MARSLEPFDFAGEDDEDAATVLMYGHHHHLLREVLKTPAPLSSHVLEHPRHVEPRPEPAVLVEDEEDELVDTGPRLGITILSVLVASTALGAAIWKYLQG